MQVKSRACWISLVLATGACKDERVDAPVAAPVAPDSVVPDADEPATTTPPEPARSSGLAGITRALIDEAQRTETEPLQLVPDAAHFVFRVQPAVLLGHAEVRALWAKTETTDTAIAGTMDVVRACMERLEAIDDVLFALDDEENGVLVAHGKGLGTELMWRCFQDQSLSKGRTFDITLTGTTRGEGPQLRESSGDLGYFPDDDTVVLVSKAWDTDVQARLRGAGTPAVEGRLAGVIRRVRRDQPLWVVGRISGKSEGGLTGSPMAGIDDVAFDLRIEDGELLLSTTVDAGEAADATRMRDELQRQFSEYESILPMLGLPGTVGDKIEFVSEGDLVSLGFTLTEAELRGLREFMERM